MIALGGGLTTRGVSDDGTTVEGSTDVAAPHWVQYGPMTRAPHDRQKFTPDRVSRPERGQRRVEGRERSSTRLIVSADHDSVRLCWFGFLSGRARAS